MSDTRLEKILVLDDDADYRRLLKVIINRVLPQAQVHEYDPAKVRAPGDDIDWAIYDVLILDYLLYPHDITGLDILHKYHKRQIFPATIMLTSTNNEETAVNALKLGVYKYLRKESPIKDQLKEYILGAWEARKKERKQQLEETKHNETFSKEIFYQKLEQQKKTDDTLGRTLLFIQLDGTERMVNDIGLIGLDSLIKHVAKHSFELFDAGNCNPNITRTSDTAIAIQIDAPQDTKLLASSLNLLCENLSELNFELVNQKYEYNVSIGALLLDSRYRDAEKPLKIARTASNRAKRDQGNSFYIWKKSDYEDHTEEEQQQIRIHADAETEAIIKLRDEIKVQEITTQKAKEKFEKEIKAVNEIRSQLEKEIQLVQEAKIRQEREMRLERQQIAELEKEINHIKKEKDIDAQAWNREKKKALVAAELKGQRIVKAMLALKAKIETQEFAIRKEKNELRKEIRSLIGTRLRLEKEAEEVKKAKVEQEKQANVINKQIDKLEKEANQAREEKRRLEENREKREKADAIKKMPNDPQKKAKSTQDVSYDASASIIKKALHEKRFVQLYQPVISLLSGQEKKAEIFKTSLRVLDEGGKPIADKDFDINDCPIELQQKIEQWMLRKTLDRLIETGKQQSPYIFLLSIGETWFNSITMFSWLKDILSEIIDFRPGKSILLKVDASLVARNEKRALALLTSLNKSYGFKVALDRVAYFDEIEALIEKINPSLLISTLEHVVSLYEKREEEKEENLLQVLEKKKIQLIADNIENAIDLTKAISVGTNYVMGKFIGETQDILTVPTNVESFELI